MPTTVPTLPTTKVRVCDVIRIIHAAHRPGTSTFVRMLGLHNYELWSKKLKKSMTFSA